jgi:hypothetical protein
MMKKRTKNDIGTVYSQYHKSVNMIYTQMLKWARNPWSNKASLSRAPIKRNLKLLKKKRHDKHRCAEVKPVSRKIYKPFMHLISGIKRPEACHKK